MSAENRAIIRRLYGEVWNKRKLGVVSEIISPSHALHAPNVSGAAVGPEAYKHQILLFLTGYPDLHFAIEDTVAENNKVVACWTFPAPTEVTLWHSQRQIRKCPLTESQSTTSPPDKL